MTATPERRPAPAGRGTLLGMVILAGVLAAAAALALQLGGGRPGWREAVGFAAAVTAAGGLGGWLAARRPAPTPAAAMVAALGATALRLIPPLAALAWLSDRGADLREAGAGGLLVIFYLVLLATVILLHIMVAPEAAARPPDGPR
ncbi:MAG: hypothetical protein ACKOZU_08175 [Planctomycetaceae bacterium]